MHGGAAPHPFGEHTITPNRGRASCRRWSVRRPRSSGHPAQTDWRRRPELFETDDRQDDMAGPRDAKPGSWLVAGKALACREGACAHLMVAFATARVMAK